MGDHRGCDHDRVEIGSFRSRPGRRSGGHPGSAALPRPDPRRSQSQARSLPEVVEVSARFGPVAEPNQADANGVGDMGRWIYEEDLNDLLRRVPVAVECGCSPRCRTPLTAATIALLLVPTSRFHPVPSGSTHSVESRRVRQGTRYSRPPLDAARVREDDSRACEASAAKSRIPAGEEANRLGKVDAAFLEPPGFARWAERTPAFLLQRRDDGAKRLWLDVGLPMEREQEVTSPARRPIGERVERIASHGARRTSRPSSRRPPGGHPR